MTRITFISILLGAGYSYDTEGDKIIVKHHGSVDINFEKTIPPNVIFTNVGNVYLNHMEKIPPGVEFNNTGSVFLDLIKSIDPSVVFHNHGSIKFHKMFMDTWEGNIEGIGSTVLFNHMIKKGIFL